MKSLLSPEKKVAGALAPLFALRGQQDLGVGDVAALREAVLWAKRNGLGFVQMLPVNHPGSDHSPYNLISSMAIDPLTVSCHPEDLPELPPAKYHEVSDAVERPVEGPVDYPAVESRKMFLLEAAAEEFFKKGKKTRRKSFEEFAGVEAGWLDPYSLHQALRERNGTEVTDLWPEGQRTYADACAWLDGLPEKETARISRRRDFFRFVQWVAHGQWLAARRFADSCGVALVGDVPVGVSIHSADVWAQPGLFLRDLSSGAPPEKVFQADPFTCQWGQNWGFPLYDWYAMSKDNFAWWRRRLRSLRRFFSLLRVDHALGFFRIYSFPWRPERNAEFLGLSEEEAKAKTGGRLPRFVPHADDTEEHRNANLAHGEILLGILAEETGPQGLIAEDLGEVPPYVRPCLAKMGLPGFKIPQWETRPDGSFTPGEEYPRLSIATYATHDHPPLREIWDGLVDAAKSGDPEKATQAEKQLRAFWQFCGEKPEKTPVRPFDKKIHSVLLRGLWKSNSWLAAANINDLFGTSDRFNVPGTASGQNWSARLEAPVSEWDTAYSEAIGAWKKEVAKFRPAK